MKGRADDMEITVPRDVAACQGLSAQPRLTREVVLASAGSDDFLEKRPHRLAGT